MSQVTAILFQFLGVVSFQIFCQLPFEWIYFPKGEERRLKTERREMLIFLFCVLLGVCVGSLTLLILKYPIIQSRALNFLNLFLTPFVVGRSINWLHNRRPSVREAYYLFENVWNAYIFAFCITAMRYILI